MAAAPVLARFIERIGGVAAGFFASRFGSLFRHSSFVIRHFTDSRHEAFHPGHYPGTRIRSPATLRPAQAREVSRCAAQISTLGTGGLRVDAARYGLVSVESATGEHLRFRGLQEA